MQLITKFEHFSGVIKGRWRAGTPGDHSCALPWGNRISINNFWIISKETEPEKPAAAAYTSQTPTLFGLKDISPSN